MSEYKPSSIVQEYINSFELRCNRFKDKGKDPMDYPWFYDEAKIIRQLVSEDEREFKSDKLVGFMLYPLIIFLTIFLLLRVFS